MHLWTLETDACRDEADVMASEILGRNVRFFQGGRLGLEISDYDHDRLAEVQAALRGMGRQAILTSRR